MNFHIPARAAFVPILAIARNVNIGHTDTPERVTENLRLLIGSAENASRRNRIKGTSAHCEIRVIRDVLKDIHFRLHRRQLFFEFHNDRLFINVVVRAVYGINAVKLRQIGSAVYFHFIAGVKRLVTSLLMMYKFKLGGSLVASLSEP